MSDQVDKSLPFVSVIVPVYNDPEGIETTLESLSRQTYPQNRYEIIAVDNGSEDETQAVIQEYCDQSTIIQLAVEDRIQGSYAARNKGIRQAQGSIIAFLDADMSVPEDWLMKGVQEMVDLGAEYMGGNVQMYFDGESEPLASEYDRRTAFPIHQYVSNHQFAPTCCLFVRDSLIEEVGTFDSRLISGGDAEFGQRVAGLGRTIHLASDVIAYHPSRRSFRSLVQKSIRVGRGIQQRRQLYPERYEHPLLELLNPKWYLPVKPRTIRSSVRGWNELSRPKRMIFYVIHYVLRLCTTIGQFYETLRNIDLTNYYPSPR